MHALVFVVHDCGFVARSALEISDSSQVRIHKLFSLIEECRFGVHDISRTELDPHTRLPRFNMPLELGVFLGAKRFGSGAQKNKNCLVLDIEPYRYQTFCSDIAGQDVAAHGGDPLKVVQLTRNWLRNAARGSGMIMPGGRRMAERHERFRDALPTICAESGLRVDDLIFNDYTTLAVAWLKDNEW